MTSSQVFVVPLGGCSTSSQGLSPWSMTRTLRGSYLRKHPLLLETSKGSGRGSWEKGLNWNVPGGAPPWRYFGLPLSGSPPGTTMPGNQDFRLFDFL